MTAKKPKARAGTAGGQSLGPSTDAANIPVIDPTANVDALVESAVARQDDLRQADRRYNDMRADLRDRHQRKVAKLRDRHYREKSKMESDNRNSIRQIDREEVAKTAAAANRAIEALASQTSSLATTLQTRVQDTAIAAESRRSLDMAEVNKRISALELTGSKSAGKEQVSDPALERLATQVAALVNLQTTGSGKSAGMNQLWGWIVGAIGLGVAVGMFMLRVVAK